MQSPDFLKVAAIPGITGRIPADRGTLALSEGSARRRPPGDSSSGFHVPFSCQWPGPLAFQSSGLVPSLVNLRLMVKLECNLNPPAGRGEGETVQSQ